MPNWCKNNLKIDTDSRATLNNIISVLTNEEGRVTFNKLIPMPKALENTRATFPHDVNDAHKSNLKKNYGAVDWYEWRMNNWGVKWDASESEIFGGLDDEVTLTFKTPWGPPEQFMKTLSREYPTVRFILQFADEFIGAVPLGEVLYEGGEAKQVRIMPDSDDEGNNHDNDKESASSDIWDERWVDYWLETINEPKGW